MSNLYQIDKEYAEIVSELYENGGEITLELEERMAENDMTFEEKGENYMKAIRNLEADSKRFEEEKKFYDDKAKRAAKTADTLKRMMVVAMQNRDLSKKSFGAFSASLRRSESVNVTDDFYFDGNSKYIREKITKEPDRIAIKEAIKNGIDIVGASLDEKYSLQIK